QKKKNGNIYDIKNNSKLTLNFVDKDGIKTEEQLEIDIIKREEKVYPMGLSEEVAILVSDKFIEKLDYKQNIMYVMSNNTNALSEEINNLKKSNDSYNMISYSDLEASRRSENAMVLVISIFLYGFIAVITLIGVTNIFNTITTNMNLRQKEFAMLKSIGMTKKEFDRMIRLESIFYGFKSLIIGIPIGILGSYFVYKAFSRGMEMSYRLPIMAIIIAIIFVFLIIGLIMKYSLSRINKQNIIETIRNENI
ncbi:MAG: ABC transporter permease, partial [Clostridia bacterium]|nr:ABC transporter permease [Clostridia bacterium]